MTPPALRLLAISAILASTVAAGPVAIDLTAHWVSRVPNGDGTFRETVVVLKQQGATLTGRVINPTSEQPIVDGTVGDGSFAFATVTGRPPNERRIEYKGVVVSADAVRIRIVRTGRPDQELTAERGPDSAGELPPRIAPPALRPVGDNGLSRTPPMGWNSWNRLRGRVDDATVRATADAMVESGMKAAGYVYVNIDDTWEAGRDRSGRILTNRKFPDMKGLADYVHGKGLKLGIYSSPGPLTCAGYEGSYGHEADDAATYAAWGIDYLKYDWCSAARLYPDSDMQAVYQKMGDALRATGRSMVFSLCQYGRNDVWKWGPEVGGNLWRTTGDIGDNWNSMTRIGFGQDSLAPFAKPGHWNDPDMLEIGNGGMTDVEYRTHMSLWALLAAPLLAGNDLRTMAADTQRILTNREVIAVDQDPLGRQGHRVRADGDLEVWMRTLSGGAIAVGLFNRGASAAQISVRCEEFQACGGYTARDLWIASDLGRFGPSYAATVPSHGVVLLRLTPTP
ncbi:MAG TPA: glycoside hydrolase family 27 protein [Vicinamibacterales bacterium]|jgi:alpha-galactosidase